jgi:hypothetical protein
LLWRAQKPCTGYICNQGAQLIGSESTQTF